ncbi:substrate-binding domain-containing protein [Streptomyces sp. enrichment culture]|uniref:vWA domain-containing protein n=1 Tax=Streptomyces sp. enrichment culture TaxID=1795815 RepID=UPI003F57E85D
MSLFDPRGLPNRALLVGVSAYDRTDPPHGVSGDLPAVEHSVTRMREVLARGRLFTDDEIEVARSPTLDAFGQLLIEAAQEAEGVLLFYFAGHGAIPSAGDELFLQMRNARVVAGGHAVFPGAEMFTTVLTVLATSRARRIVVILDCCFAGNAAWVWETFHDKRRVLLLMSVQANHRIDAGDPGTPTPCTAALADLLDEPGEAGFRDVSERLRERMSAGRHRTVRDERWEPQWRAEPDVDVLLVAGTTPPTGTPSPGTPPDDPSSPAPPDGPPSTPPDGPPPLTPSDGPPFTPPDDPPSTTPPDGPPSTPSDGLSSTTPPDGPPPPAPPDGPSPGDPPDGPLRGGTHASPGPGERSPGRIAARLAAALRAGRARVLAWLAPAPLGAPGGRGIGRLVLAAVLGAVLLGAGGYGLFRLVAADDALCAPPVELRVLTGPDLEPTLRTAADAFVASADNTAGDGCRRAGVTVHSAGAADVVDALSRQSGLWQEPRDEDTNPQRDIGPQPDVWIPASGADVARVVDGQDTDAVAALETVGEPLAYSPVVLAVPQHAAGEAQTERTGRTLTEMIEELTGREEDAAVRRPDPEFSAVGLLATVGLYGEDARAADRGERMVAQPGPPSPTAGELLCTLPDDKVTDNRTSALVPEFLLLSGVDCDSNTRTPRMAQYPQDVPGMEPAFVRVRWRGGDRDAATRDAAAEAFRAWLAGPQGRAVFALAGFRDPDTRMPLDERRPWDGVLHAPSPLHESAGQRAMERALAEYREAGGPGRVLYLLDSSGSMGRLWEGPSGGPGLLRQSLGGLGGRDVYGVWGVAGDGDEPYRTVLPLAAHRRADAERTIGLRAEVQDAEADPHAALLAAFDVMERLGDDGRPQLIVHITDGEDHDRLTGARLREVLDRAETAGVPVTVVSLQNAGCDADRPDRRIAEASGGRCLDAADDLGPALQDEVARTGTGDG